MKKKLISLLLCVALVFTMAAPASAATNSVKVDASVNVVNLSEKITSQQLQEIVDSTGAYIQTADGTLLPVNALITVEDVADPTITKSLASSQNAYKVSVRSTLSSEKVVPGSNGMNGNGYNLAATLQLIWIDNFGTDNIIKNVSGTLTVLQGTITSGTVRWGDELLNHGFDWTEVSVGSSPSFSYSPNMHCLSPSAEYWIDVKEATFPLVVKAKATIFQ